MRTDRYGNTHLGNLDVDPHRALTATMGQHGLYGGHLRLQVLSTMDQLRLDSTSATRIVKARLDGTLPASIEAQLDRSDPAGLVVPRARLAVPRGTTV